MYTAPNPKVAYSYRKFVLTITRWNAAVSPIVFIFTLLLFFPSIVSAQSWNAGSGGALYYNSGNVGIGVANPAGALEVDLSPYSQTGLIDVLLMNPIGTWRSYDSFNSYRFLQTSSAASDGNFRAFNVGPGGVTIGYPNTPIYGSSDALYVNGNVGIGTSSPSASLEVDRDGQTGLTAVSLRNSVGTWGTFAAFNSYRFLQTSSAASDGNFKAFNLGPGGMAIGYVNVPTYGSADALYVNGHVGIGTTSPSYPLSVNGTIQAKEVIVNTGWADYVFEPGYKLSSIDSVRAFIKENHRLPGIPSERDVKEHGANVGEIQAKLLAKIEEVTLQLIQEHEQNKLMVQSDREIKQRLRYLENRLRGKDK